MIDHYILDEFGNPVPEPDFLKWAKWFEQSREKRFLKRDELADGACVSTVFLGINHSFGGSVPLLWETMIFDAGEDEFQKRYPDKYSALIGHDLALKLIIGRRNRISQ